MPDAGWYPDPGGRTGHFRYWDGQTWALTTSPTPGAGPGAGGPFGGDPQPPRGPRRRSWGVLVVVAAVLLVLVVAGALVVRDRNRPVVDHGPAPTTTTSPGDDTSPSATPTPSDSPSPSPTADPGETASATPCPIGDPTARQAYPEDGRVHGGDLSIPRPSGWTYPGVQSTGFTWAYDVGETDVRVQPQWFASYAVGALSIADGFEDPRSAARLAMACTVSSSFYRGVTGRTDLVDEAATVDGHRAWTIRSEIRIDDPRTTLEGDTVQITVVDLGADSSLAFFWGCAPIGDPTLTTQLDAVAQRLRAG